MDDGVVTVAVLGHRGMLGSRVVAALAPRHQVITFQHRWPESDLVGAVVEAGPDWVINCIGGGYPEWAILPRALHSRFGHRLIQPSTDAIAEDTAYALAKRQAEVGTVIRCSIVDPDGGLLRRVRDSIVFVADTLPHWNGITAMAWAGVAERVIAGNLTGPLIIPGSPPVSIQELALTARRMFGWRTLVESRPTEGPDRRQVPTLAMPPIADQLGEYLR